MTKGFLLAEVKSTDATVGAGTFDVVLSTPTLDRDGEVIDSGAFDPLPPRITFDTDHGMSTATTVGSGVPFYDEAGDLRVTGEWSSIPRAQEVRTLVREGHIATVSVAFMGATRSVKDGVTHITRAELLNGAFVAVPSNREAVVLDAKSGARNSSKDAERLQAIHDLTVENGAECAAGKAAPGSGVVRKGHGLSAQNLRSLLDIAVSAARPGGWPWLRDYSDEWVVWEESGMVSNRETLYQQAYVFDGSVPTLVGDPVPVAESRVYTPLTSTEAPVTPAEEAGKSLASTVAAAYRCVADVAGL